VKRVGQAYRLAAQKHYGVNPPALRFGDITKSKPYATVFKALPVLLEHGIEPGRWADWYLGNAKGKNRNLPTVTEVFSPKVLTKFRGWYRSAHEGAYGGRLQLTRAHLEQVCRLQEVHALNRGELPEAAMRVGPPWYVDMRKKEIAAGNVDPNDFWPNLPDDTTHAA